VVEEERSTLEEGESSVQENGMKRKEREERKRRKRDGS
jgi:hypothetical protein